MAEQHQAPVLNNRAYAVY